MFYINCVIVAQVANVYCRVYDRNFLYFSFLALKFDPCRIILPYVSKTACFRFFRVGSNPLELES